MFTYQNLSVVDISLFITKCRAQKILLNIKFSETPFTGNELVTCQPCSYCHKVNCGTSGDIFLLVSKFLVILSNTLLESESGYVVAHRLHFTFDYITSSRVSISSNREWRSNLGLKFRMGRVAGNETDVVKVPAKGTWGK